MKSVYIIIVASFFSIKAYSQKESPKIDSTIESLRTYLLKNIKYPATELKAYTQGRMIICFKLNKNKMIDDIHFVRHLTSECDSEVLKAIRSYSQALSLPSGEYTIGLQFFILFDGKPDSKIMPFDKDLYKNFLFELNVTSESPEQQKKSIIN
ncbi:hypothetical protein ACPPVU_21875 [Mucilaginibacter sp. McL0603]|uniref:hypothetical protein n=1 Tax=Mucilaginibacter sp. McL0603 TaxID=3415670 RepID=UPI003CF0D658